MTRRLRIALAVAAALAILILLGPRPTVDVVDTSVTVPRDPAALEAWLRDREAGFDDIVPGTEARIRWADPDDPARTDLSVVYLHGFSAGHRETAPLTETLADSLGANAYLTRLTGHGRPGEALGEATTESWLRDAAEAMAVGRALGRRVVLLGVSTGGTLATWAAAHEELGDDVAAVILLSPNFRIADPTARILTWPWGGLVARLTVGPERTWEPRNPEQGRYWTTSYPTRVLPEMAALVALADDEMLTRVSAPTLVFVSPDDRVIDPDAVIEAFDRLGAADKEIVYVTDATDPSSHVLAGHIMATPERTQDLARRIIEFIEGRVP